MGSSVGIVVLEAYRAACVVSCLEAEVEVVLGVRLALLVESECRTVPVL